MSLKDRADLWRRHRKWTYRLREIERESAKERTRHRRAVSRYEVQAARCHDRLREIEDEIAGVSAGPH